MRRRQGIRVVAEMVLAELAGLVAEVVQELCQRRRAGPQIGGASGQLGRDHAGAQRMHAGEEGVAAGRAALLGIVVGEHRAFIADPVDVRRLADHQAAMVDARLHPADVVAHDEEDIGLSGGLRLGRGQGGCGKKDASRYCSPGSFDRRANGHGEVLMLVLASAVGCAGRTIALTQRNVYCPKGKIAFP